MSPQNDNQKLLDFYGGLTERYGINTPKSLSWNSEESQKIRFAVLSEIANLENKSVLDVGCGFGDLYPFLKNKYSSIRYTGIDVVPLSIKTAEANHPGIEFIEADFGSYPTNQFDFILASGCFSIKVPNHKEVYFKMIKKMFDEAKIGAGFNMLNSKHHDDDETFAAYSLAEVYELCSSLTEKIVIRQDYLSHDFTFYLYH